MLIYVAINTVNGKRYVGATTLDNVRERRWRHKNRAKRGRTDSPNRSQFHADIRAHGYRKFLWITAEKCTDERDLAAAEQRWIRALRADDPAHGYNLTWGGRGSPGLQVPGESRARMSASARARGSNMTADGRATLAKANRDRALHGPKIPRADYSLIATRRARGETFASIARSYSVNAAMILRVCRDHGGNSQ